MMLPPEDRPSGPSGPVVTRWTLVVRAPGGSPEARAALSDLYAAYYGVVEAFIRRETSDPEAARDLTQEFFAQLLEHHWVAHADRHKGRFRSFLLTAMKRFLANEWGKLKTVKRGGRAQRVPLALDAAETRYLQEPADRSTPEQVFEKRWALALLESVLGRLREEYVRDGKAVLFDTLKPCLLGRRESQPYATVAAELEMTEGAVKVAVCRLRERYRDRLRKEIAHTVASPGEVDEEVRHLFRVLARR